MNKYSTYEHILTAGLYGRNIPNASPVEARFAVARADQAVLWTFSPANPKQTTAGAIYSSQKQRFARIALSAIFHANRKFIWHLTDFE